MENLGYINGDIMKSSLLLRSSRFLSVLFLINMLGISSVLAAPKNQSVYTPLLGKSCLTLSRWHEGAEIECAGFAGFRVRLEDDDARQSLTLIKRGQVTPLNLWHVVTRHLSVLGQRIEWRVVKTKKGFVATALIVRIKIVLDERSNRSDLIVVDLQRKKPCVVGVISKGKHQNQLARNKADQATRLPCFSELPL